MNAVTQTLQNLIENIYKTIIVLYQCDYLLTVGQYQPTIEVDSIKLIRQGE